MTVSLWALSHHGERNSTLYKLVTDEALKLVHYRYSVFLLCENTAMQKLHMHAWEMATLAHRKYLDARKACMNMSASEWQSQVSKQSSTSSSCLKLGVVAWGWGTKSLSVRKTCSCHKSLQVMETTHIVPAKLWNQGSPAEMLEGAAKFKLLFH